MILTLAVLTGCLLDFLLGDPEGIPHPVVLMGACITKAERILRRIFPKSPKGELAGGCVLAAFLPTTVFLIAFVACRVCLRIHPAVYYLLESFWCYQSLAARGLAREAEGVRGALTEQGLASARKQVSRIVGRDTDGLDGAGVIRACVETVAENSSDGVAAPLRWMTSSISFRAGSLPCVGLRLHSPIRRRTGKMPGGSSEGTGGITPARIPPSPSPRAQARSISALAVRHTTSALFMRSRRSGRMTVLLKRRTSAVA